MIIEPGAVARLPIDRLSVADADECVALAADRGWPPEPVKWRLLFDFGTILGARDPTGGLAGCVVLTSYGPSLAAIGMMLVAARHEGQGLGRALLGRALSLAGSAVTMLFATESGLPLYERMGFQPADVSIRHIGEFTTTPAAGPRAPAGPAVSTRSVASPGLARLPGLSRLPGLPRRRACRVCPGWLVCRACRACRGCRVRGVGRGCRVCSTCPPRRSGRSPDGGPGLGGGPAGDRCPGPPGAGR